MIERYCDGITPAPPDGFVEADKLLCAAEQPPEYVAALLQAFAFDRALNAIWVFVAPANRYVSQEAPWNLAKASTSHDRRVASENAVRLHRTLFSLWSALLMIPKCIIPRLPETGRKLLQELGEADEPSGKALPRRRIEVGRPLFPKL